MLSESGSERKTKAFRIIVIIIYLVERRLYRARENKPGAEHAIIGFLQILRKQRRAARKATSVQHFTWQETQLSPGCPLVSGRFVAALATAR
ncbi:hypothetical protein MRX96_014473 [Rhipicephalus microplus]